MAEDLTFLLDIENVHDVKEAVMISSLAETALYDILILNVPLPLFK